MDVTAYSLSLQVLLLHMLADEGALHLLPPLVVCPGGPAPYLTGAPLPQAVLELWARLLGDGALERSLESGSAAGELALFHLAAYLFPEKPEAGVVPIPPFRHLGCQAPGGMGCPLSSPWRRRPWCLLLQGAMIQVENKLKNEP